MERLLRRCSRWRRLGQDGIYQHRRHNRIPPSQSGEGFAYTHNGFIGGGQVGCNHQINQWVLGVEGTFAGTTIKGDAADLAILNDDVFATKINSLATVTARIGYAWNNVLLYAKGGYAGANVQLRYLTVLRRRLPMEAGTIRIGRVVGR